MSSYPDQWMSIPLGDLKLRIVEIFLDSKITAGGDCNHEVKDACSLEEKL